MQRKVIGEHAKISMQESGNTVRLFRYNNQISYVGDMNVIFHPFSCRNCDTFFKRTSIFNRQLPSLRERWKHVYAKNVYQIRITLSDKLDVFIIK